MTRSTYLAGAAALACLPMAAGAQEAFLLDEIVISATIGAAPLQSTGVTATVLTREEIAATGETRLVDVLDRVPGVGVLARGPVGTLSSITLRGAGRNYVQVLVDGIDVSDPSAPQVAFDFGRLTTADVSRVEILRGAQSALYGSQAIGGVISITTTRAEAEGVEQRIALEAGSYGTVAGSYTLAARRGESDAAITVSRIATDGFSAADGNAGNTEADAYRATRLSFSAGTVLERGVELRVSGFYDTGAGEYDEQFPVADGSPDEESSFDSWGLRAAATFDLGAVENTVALSGFAIDRSDTGSTGFGASEITYEGRRLALSYTGTTDLGAGRLSFGANATRESYEQGGTFGTNDGESSVAALYAEYALSGASFDATASLRLDEHSEFGSFVTGRLAGAWQARSDLTVRGAVATGFRAPSGYELFGPFGDPTLEPEESLSLDLGIEKRYGDRAMARATLFYNETTDLVDFVGAGYTQIPGTVTRAGVELEGQVALSDAVTLSGNYTYTDATTPDVSAGNAWRANFGTHDLSLTLDARITERLAGALSLQYVADREDLPDYGVASARIGYAVTEDAEVYLRVVNLTDEQYQLVEGYGTSDRAVYAGFRARF